MKGPKFRGAHRVFGDHKETLLAIGAPQIWVENGPAGVRTGDLLSGHKWKEFPTPYQPNCPTAETREFGLEIKPRQTVSAKKEETKSEPAGFGSKGVGPERAGRGG